MKYIYLLVGDENERELAFAEAIAVSGGRPCAAKLVEADRFVNIERTAYIAAGLELLAHGKDLDEARRSLAGLTITADGFGIDIHRVPRGLPVGRRDAANAFAQVINGRPNLDQPRERFLGILTPEGVWFGRALPSAEPEWRRFVKKPCDFSSALPARNARAVCNLLVRGGESVVDPCCGTGSLLIHAAALGARVTGFDINRKMAGATNTNLLHFGFPKAATQADAAEVSGDYDLLITNIPYGNMSAVSPEKAMSIVTNIVRLAPRGAVVAGDDISGQIRAAGVNVKTITLHKFSMTRYVFVYERT